MNKMNYASLHELITAAEESEKRARVLLESKHEVDSCIHDHGNEECIDCEDNEACESMTLAAQIEIKSLFESAWKGYHEVETLAREYVQEADSAEGYALLAQALIDIHIHPNSGFERDTQALWEAQCLWLHLYFRTGEQAYFEQAKLCDGIRHASVVKIQD
jgi:hypothetical protein